MFKFLRVVLPYVPYVAPALKIAQLALPFAKLVAEKTKNKTDDEIIRWLEQEGLGGVDIILNGTDDDRNKFFNNLTKQMLLKAYKEVYMENKDNIIDSGVQLSYTILKGKEDGKARK